MISKFGFALGLIADFAVGATLVLLGFTLIIAAEAGWLYVL